MQKNELSTALHESKFFKMNFHLKKSQKFRQKTEDFKTLLKKFRFESKKFQEIVKTSFLTLKNSK